MSNLQARTLSSRIFTWFLVMALIVFFSAAEKVGEYFREMWDLAHFEWERLR